MEENNNINVAEETKKEEPKKFKIRICSPIRKVPVEDTQKQAEETSNEVADKKEKPRWVQRLADMGKGALAAVFVLGAAAVVYADKKLKNLDESEEPEETEDEDDEEENESSEGYESNEEES